jgi:hypothetical protein
MKNILFLLVLVLSLNACFQDSDINVDPNRSTTVDPALLFAGAATNLSLLRVGELTWPVALGSQMWASGGRWGLSQANYDQTRIRSAWGKTYTDILKNLNVAQDQIEASTNPNPNTIAQIKILKAFTYSQTTFLWGDIPFSEAATGKVDFPKFDAQADVLNGCLKLLNESIASINESSKGIIAPNDLYYGGDMAKWKKLANSLKLRILFAMVDSDPTKASEIGTIVTANSAISSVADNMQFKYFNQPGRQNPRFSFTAIFRGGVQSDWYCAKPVYDMLVALNDPRIPYFFQVGPAAAPNEFIALTSTENFTTKSSLVHLDLLKPDLPEVSFSYSEQLLFEAEAIARGFAPGGFEVATSRLRKGVEESLKSFGVPAAQATTYANSLPALTSSNFKKVIAEQQYLDLFMRPIEGWTQNRRSGDAANEIPKLATPPAAPVSGLFRRILYRNEEINSNPNTPKGVNIDTPMWFDK